MIIGLRPIEQHSAVLDSARELTAGALVRWVMTQTESAPRTATEVIPSSFTELRA